MRLPKDPHKLKRIEKLVEIRENRVDFFMNHHRNNMGNMLDPKYWYLHDIYNSLAPDMVLQSCVQSGKTEFLIMTSFAMAKARVPVLYVLPKYELKNRVVQNRVDKSVAYTPEYKRMMAKDANADVKLNSCSLKSFNGTAIAYAGSNVADDFVEIPVSALIVDELQYCDQQNVKLALNRLVFSPYRPGFTIYSGNPRFIGADLALRYQQSDQREWHVKCSCCGKLERLDWFENVVKCTYDATGAISGFDLRDTEWNHKMERDIVAVCSKCDGKLEKFKPGVWIPQNPECESGAEGYHISKLITGITEYREIWKEFSNAVDNPSDLQQFYNDSLGLPYSASGSKLSLDTLDICVGDYVLINNGDEAFVEDRKHPGPCYMGVDVGKRLDVQIHAEENGKRKLVYCGKVNYLDDVHELIHSFNVECVVIDSQPDTSLVEELLDTAECEAWMAKYSPSEGTYGSPKYNDKDARITVDRTHMLDRSLTDYRRRKVILPKNFRGLIREKYVKEMTAPLRQEEETPQGIKKFVWRTAGVNTPDHQRHADCYSLLAFDLSGAAAGASNSSIEVF